MDTDGPGRMFNFEKGKRASMFLLSVLGLPVTHCRFHEVLRWLRLGQGADLCLQGEALPVSNISQDFAN